MYAGLERFALYVHCHVLSNESPPRLALLLEQVTRLHNLDADQKFRFICEGCTLPPGMAISETPLANSENLEVMVHPIEWPVKRGRTHMSACPVGVPATQIRRGDNTPYVPPRSTPASPNVIIQ